MWPGLAVVFAVLVASCSLSWLPLNSARVSFSFSFPAARTLSPDTDQAVNRLEVTGNGPGDETFSNALSPDEPTLSLDLTPGLWTFKVLAQNTESQTLWVGLAEATLEAGEAQTVTIVLQPGSGVGMIKLSLTLPNGGSGLTARASAVSDTTDGSALTVATTEEATELTEGYHELLVEVEDTNSDVVWATREIVRIVEGATTHVSAVLTADDLHPSLLVGTLEAGPITQANLDSVPLTLTISSSQASPVVGVPFTVTAVPGPGDVTNLGPFTVSWYYQGQEVPGETSLTLSTTLASDKPANYSAIVSGKRYKASSSLFVQALSQTKNFTSFNLSSPATVGAIADVSETTGTVDLTVPFGTDVTTLVPSFSTSGTAVTVGAVVQTSGTDSHDFTNPVHYLVSASDGTTKDYKVKVTVSPNTAKAITAFSISSPVNATGTINGTTITVNVPAGTNRSAMVASFTAPGIDRTEVGPGPVIQDSGVTPNDFSDSVNGVDYTVWAMDGTSQVYKVYVYQTGAVVINISSPSLQVLSFSNANPIVSLSGGTALTISTTNTELSGPGGTNWKWYLDNVLEAGETTSTYHWKWAGKTLGDYIINVKVTYNNILYSGSLKVTVEE